MKIKSMYIFFIIILMSIMNKVAGKWSELSKQSQCTG